MSQDWPEVDHLLRDAPVACNANACVFEQLLGLAQRASAEGDSRSSAAWACSAAKTAHFHHTGLFASDALEESLLGSAASWPTQTVEQLPVRHILHVASALFLTGGHSRLLANWIRLDSRRRHSLVLTMQARRHVPEIHEQLVFQARGEVVELEGQTDDLTERAAKLVQTTQRLRPDLIVLHTHPHDVVPTLAFGNRPQGLRVALMNHADHKFWIGRHAADMFIHFRQSSLELSVARRGIPRDRCAILPLPVTHSAVRRPRMATRSGLGVSDDAVLMLTVGTAYKYADLGPFRLDEYVDALLKNVPNSVLAFVGPDRVGKFLELSEKWPGRVLVLGRRTDLDALMAAADVYVDSYPLGSATADLDAMLAGLPLVSLHRTEVDNKHYLPDGGALDSVGFRFFSIKSAVEQVRAWALNPELRAKVGAINKAIAVPMHTGQGWLDRLEAFYQDLPRVPLTALSAPVAQCDIVDKLNILLFDMGPVQTASETALEFGSLFSSAPKLKIFIKSGSFDMRILRAFVPPWLRVLARKLRPPVESR